MVQRSNFISDDTLIIGEPYLDQMRDFLSVIHDEFAILYDAVGKDNFAMDIEYKITSADQLIIKQARPWVSFILAEEEEEEVNDDELLENIFPNPARENISIKCADCQLATIRIFDGLGRLVEEYSVSDPEQTITQIPINRLPIGVYFLSAFTGDEKMRFSSKFIKY